MYAILLVISYSQNVVPNQIDISPQSSMFTDIDLAVNVGDGAIRLTGFPGLDVYRSFFHSFKAFGRSF